jgi:hypothetical protein
LIGKERRLVKASLAKSIGIGYINSRDYPGVCAFIDEKNEHLKRLRPKGINKNKINKDLISLEDMTKGDLIKIIREKSSENKRLISHAAESQIQLLSDNGLVGSQRELALTVESLRAQNIQLSKDIDRATREKKNPLMKGQCCF